MHILVVEPNEFARPTIVEMLEGRGHCVSAAETADTMRRLLTGNQGIDAVVLDATLSGQGADSLALHAKERGLPVVMISGHPDCIKFALTNRLQLLWKPFRCNELCEALGTAVASGVRGQRDASTEFAKDSVADELGGR